MRYRKMSYLLVMCNKKYTQFYLHPRTLKEHEMKIRNAWSTWTDFTNEMCFETHSINNDGNSSAPRFAFFKMFQPIGIGYICTAAQAHKTPNFRKRTDCQCFLEKQ